MSIQACLRHWVSGACLLAFAAVAMAQTNPLYEHRRTVANGVPAKSLLEDSFVAQMEVGRATLGTDSSRLIDAGVKSGDPMLIDLGRMSLRVYVAYRDELERAAQYYAETKKPGSLDPGPFLVVDREDPRQPIVLETSAGDASIYLDVLTGSRVSLRSTSGPGAPSRRMK